MLLINTWICVGIFQKQNLNLLYNLRNNYRQLGVFKILPNIQNGLGVVTKNSYKLQPGTISERQNIIFERNVNTVGLLNIPGF